MKHLKLYENAGQTVYVLKLDDIFENKGSFSSYIKIFHTKQHAENYLINLCNDLQEEIVNDDEPITNWGAYTDKEKEKFGQYKLNDYDTCSDFLYELSSDFGPKDEEDFETYIAIDDYQIENVEIKDNVKTKIEANKYNL
jgi:hypothetical protein